MRTYAAIVVGLALLDGIQHMVSSAYWLDAGLALVGLVAFFVYMYIAREKRPTR